MSDDNENVENDGEDLATLVRELREQLAAERGEKQRVDAKNKELVREKQKIASKAEDIETIRATLADRERELRNIKLDGEIAKGITAHNVRPEMARAVAAIIRSEASFEDGEASIGGRSVADHMKAFLTSRDGQHFVRAADNTGAGATGATTQARTSFAGRPFNLTEYSSLKRTDPASAAAWASASGQGYLNQL